MSRRSDGAYRCDRCDLDVGNAGVDRAAMVADVDPDDPGTVRNLHFCREPNTGAPDGCAAHLLTPANVAAWTSWRHPDDPAA